MSIRHRPDLEERGSVLWRSVVVLLLVGAGLGLVSNAVLLAAGSKRGLTWIRTEKKLESLEDLAASPGAVTSEPSTTPDPVATDPAPVNPTGSTPTATAKKPPAASEPKPSTPTPASSEAKPPGGPPAAGTVAAPHAEKSAATGVKPDVPTVPDSRDPIQAKMAMVKRFFDADAALFVDAREAIEYAEGHIAGAVSLPFDEAFKDPKKLAIADAGARPIIVYCGGGDCEASRNLAYSLIDAGRKKVVIFEEGFPAWKNAGYPVATGKEPGGAK